MSDVIATLVIAAVGGIAGWNLAIEYGRMRSRREDAKDRAEYESRKAELVKLALAEVAALGGEEAPEGAPVGFTPDGITLLRGPGGSLVECSCGACLAKRAANPAN